MLSSGNKMCMKTCETCKKSKKKAVPLSTAKKYLTNRPLYTNRAKLWMLVRTKLNPNLSHSHFKTALAAGLHYNRLYIWITK